MNPIHVARKVLDESTKPLSLRRVSPNLLVGDGATDFAYSHGISIVHEGYLISEGARDRYDKWTKELALAKGFNHSQQFSGVENLEARQAQQTASVGAARSKNPTIAALANESQSFSPRIAPVSPDRPSAAIRQSPSISPSRTSSMTRSDTPHPDYSRPSGRSDVTVLTDHNPGLSINLTVPGRESIPSPIDEGYVHPGLEHMDVFIDNDANGDSPRSMSSWSDAGSAVDPHFSALGHGLPSPSHQHDGATMPASSVPRVSSRSDMITDTVGAIAVDSHGNIAAGSSSGGIGMKLKGRTGPAALVGVGTAIMPVHPDDPDATTVACVTSGTGEHMATTMAASTCAQRMYSCEKVGRPKHMVPTDEDTALQSFVDNDFMGHPSVRTSHSVGAIGTMTVKRTKDGLWLYFAHNTDSFVSDVPSIFLSLPLA